MKVVTKQDHVLSYGTKKGTTIEVADSVAKHLVKKGFAEIPAKQVEKQVEKPEQIEEQVEEVKETPAKEAKKAKKKEGEK